jgi:glycoside/pentoside/hexuronide:cation symporter, GPH family
MSGPERQRDRLSTGTLLAYGALGLPLAALNLPLYVYLPAFYAEDMGLGLAAVGLILFAARLLDTVTDPLIGEFSDRTRGRLGRRRPWLIAACPLLIVASMLLFVPPAGAGAGHLLLWSCVAYLAWTMMILPYAAWGAELSGDYHERSRITGAREGFVILGILFAAALPALLGAGPEGGNARTLEALAWSMAILVPAALVALLAVVPEPRRPIEPPLRLLAGLKIAARNRPFLRLIAAYLLNGIANGLPATLFLLFVANVLGQPERAGLLLLLYFLTGVAGIPLWLRLSRRIGKHRAWSAAMLWACLAFVWVPLLGAGDFWPFLVICLLSGLALGADLALPASIQADVVDLDWVESGRRRTGLFFALWSMATKLSLALAVGIAFPVLEFAGFVPGGANGAGALLTLAALYGLVPVAIKLAAVALVWNFPLGADAQAETRRRLPADPSLQPSSGSD